MSCLSNSTTFDLLMQEGKQLAAEGKIFESLKKFQLAQKIPGTEEKKAKKVLERIHKLKEHIQKHKLSKPKSTTEISNENDSKEAGGVTEIHVEKSSLTTTKDKFAGHRTLSLNPSEVLHDIKNVKSYKDLSPEEQIRFNQLKKKAMEHSYQGELEDALDVFEQALKLCDCPTVKSFIADVKALLQKHSSEVQEFKHLAESGKKLAIQGKQTESIKKLKDALDICPSPKVMKLIKYVEESTQSVSKQLFTDDDDDSVFHSKKGKSPFSASSTEFSSIEGSKSGSSGDFEKTETVPTDPKSLTPIRQSKYKELYGKARIDASEGRLREALAGLKEASKICNSEKIEKRIKDLKEHIKKADEIEMDKDNEMVAVTEGFFIFHEIYEKLYPYQREGVAWMYGLFKKKKGGVLGDDMGLGKTFQVIAFLSGLIDADLIKHVLIIMPVSLLTNWENEFKKWCPGIKVFLFHGTSKSQREKNALKVQKRGHVLLTSYGMVVNNLEYLDHAEGTRFIWDYVILDEGHKIKNPTKTTKAVHEIPARNRLVLTGTPIQNNLRELWALYDFVHQGALLGSMKTFKMQYENIITRAREKDATAGEKRLGTKMAENLKRLIQPYFLRRGKDEIWGKESAKTDIKDIECKMADLQISKSNQLTSRKNDLIIWLMLSDKQCAIYRDFLTSDAVKTILVSKRSPLVELTTLKKICDHPRLLSQRACLQLGLDGQLDEDDLIRRLEDEEKSASSIENVSDDTLINESGKMKFLISLLENLKQNGHRTLVFSLSRKILDMVHRILTNRNWKVLRIDGTITKIEERERRIQLFQNDKSFPVFLLTTQVGGVGITLTAADRVIIYDPSWNPATDAQAVDRAYRIGQKNDVVVYRLMTCATVEEKIYRRQIFKDSITRQATQSGQSDPYRYFSKQELRELFGLEDHTFSATQVQLSQMHAGERKTDTALDEHIAFLHSLDIFGISDHDLMFSKNIQDDTEDNDEAAISHDYIKKQVAVAQQLIQAEAAVVEDGLRLAGNFVRPYGYVDNIPLYKKASDKDLYKPPSLPDVIDLTDDIPKIIKENKSSEESDNDISVFHTPQSPNLQKGAETPLSMNKNPIHAFKPLPLEKNKITSYFTSAVEVLPLDMNNSKNASIKDYSFTQKTHETPNTPEKMTCDDSVEIITYSNKKGSNTDYKTPQQFKEKSAASSYKNKLSIETRLNDSNKHLRDGFHFSGDTDAKENNNSDFIEKQQSNIVSELDISRIKKPIFCSTFIDKLQVDDIDINDESIEETELQNETKADISKKESISEGYSPSEKDKSEEQLKELSFSSPDEPKNEFSSPDVNELSSKITSTKTPKKQISDNSFTTLDVKALSSEISPASEEFKVNRDLSTALDIAEKSVVQKQLKNVSLVTQEFSVCEPVLSGVTTSEHVSGNSPNTLSSQINNNMNENMQEIYSGFECSPSIKRLNSDKTMINNKSIKENTITSTSPFTRKASHSDDLILISNQTKPEETVVDSSHSEMKDLEEDIIHTPYEKIQSGSQSGSPFNSPVRQFPETYRTSSPIPNQAISLSKDLTNFLNESLEDLNISNKPMTSYLRNRKSCARLTQQFLSESDTSQITSGSSSANTSHEKIVSESEDSDAYNEEESVASVSLNESGAIIPSSIPSTPVAKGPLSKLEHKTSPISPRRITPLRLHKSYHSPKNGAFAKALATSPLIGGNKMEKTLIEASSTDIEESPVKVYKKKGKNMILSDSESSDLEDNKGHCSILKTEDSYYSDAYSSEKNNSSDSDCFQTPSFHPMKSKELSPSVRRKMRLNDTDDSIEY